MELRFILVPLACAYWGESNRYLQCASPAVFEGTRKLNETLFEVQRLRRLVALAELKGQHIQYIKKAKHVAGAPSGCRGREFRKNPPFPDDLIDDEWVRPYLGRATDRGSRLSTCSEPRVASDHFTGPQTRYPNCSSRSAMSHPAQGTSRKAVLF